MSSIYDSSRRLLTDLSNADLISVANIAASISSILDSITTSYPGSIFSIYINNKITIIILIIIT